MTFCGDLPFVPSGIHHHLFENLRRKGHHCHGLTHLSWAERKIFYRVLGKKFCGLFIYPGQSVRQVVAVSAPGDRGLNRCMAPDTTTGRHPPQRRRARARNGVAPYIPAAFCRDARSAGHGATEAARPFGRCKPGVFTHRTVARARNRASGFGGDWRVRQQLPVGVGPDDRMPPGSREPKVSPPPEIRTTETT